MPTSTANYSPTDYVQAIQGKMHERQAMEAYAISVVGLEQYPDNGMLMCLAAQACLVMDRLREAKLYVDKARSANVAMALAHELYGDICLLENSPGEAVKAYRQAEALDDARDVIKTKIDKARQIMLRNRPVQGKRRQTLGFAEEMAQAGRHERDGDPAKAEEIYRDILRRDPDHVEAIRLLAAIASSHRKYRDAEVFLQRATQIAPDYARIWLDLTAAQLEQEKLEQATASAGRLVELSPDIAESHIALGNALARADRAEPALLAYQAALEVSVGHPGAFSGMAQQLKTLGRGDEAIAAHRDNLRRNPGLAEPYWSLANMKTFRFTDEDIANMEMLVEKEGQAELSIVQLCNALGFAYEGRKSYQRAFHFFQRGNLKRRESEIYDPVETEVSTDRHIKVFNKTFMEKNKGFGVTDAAPIFVVGLPRSGSTLIEQILASHSQVEGTHELSDLAQVVRTLPRAKQGRERFPENLPGLKTHFWEQLGEDYLLRTLKYRSGATYFIDKNPNNFVYVGLIQLILPNAKIINARRHPLDSCFGSYKQLFASGQPFTYDLTEIGEYYIQYQKLMEHWQDLLPGRVLDVQYEDVVTDLDTQVRRLLHYCELPFEDACLNFHETERAVKTASSEQVRQPIYSSSVDLWRNYGQELEELVDTLEPLLLEGGWEFPDSRPIG